LHVYTYDGDSIYKLPVRERLDLPYKQDGQHRRIPTPANKLV
jgi:hypothetical protein